LGIVKARQTAHANEKGHYLEGSERQVKKGATWREGGDRGERRPPGPIGGRANLDQEVRWVKKEKKNRGYQTSTVWSVAK